MKCIVFIVAHFVVQGKITIMIINIFYYLVCCLLVLFMKTVSELVVVKLDSPF